MTIEQYIEDRDRPEHAFITGTQLGVYAVQARLDAGETVDDIAADYPDVPRDAFHAARNYLWVMRKFKKAP